MCLAYPGKIVEIKADIAVVDYQTQQCEAKLVADDYQVGEYVIVQAGFVVQKVPEKQALDSLRIYGGDVS